MAWFRVAGHLFVNESQRLGALSLGPAVGIAATGEFFHWVGDFRRTESRA